MAHIVTLSNNKFSFFLDRTYLFTTVGGDLNKVDILLTSQPD
jgi:hypothetical protein